MTQHSAEDWKARALYEEGRRKHVEDELVRLRDEIDGILLAAAREDGLGSTSRRRRRDRPRGGPRSTVAGVRAAERPAATNVFGRSGGFHGEARPRYPSHASDHVRDVGGQGKAPPRTVGGDVAGTV